MIFNEIFDKIYVLNLKESLDRKNHIENEFKRVNIINYTFFEATPYDSDEVKNLMNSNFVKKFPNCFRCNNKRCNCENNFLTSFQIANWCSFIRIFQDIIQNNYNFVLICEDDIVFTFQYERIINKLLSKYTFKQYNIDMNKPLLIRLGTAYNPSNHNSNSEPIFLKNFSLCNPCFAINKKMAIIYLYYLKIIDYHSDIYFHRKIPKNIKGVQYFTMYPYPVYELSYVKEKQKFQSLIRPNNQLRRIEYKEFLFLTSNKLLEVSVKNITKKMNLDIGSNLMINFHGNINSYIFLNENEKKKYYFEYKILFMDDLYDDIKILYKNINIDIYNIYIKKINDIYNVNIHFLENNEELLKNIIIFYNSLIKIFKNQNIMILNINNMNDIQKLSNILDINIVKKEIVHYVKYKNLLLLDNNITNNDIDIIK